MAYPLYITVRPKPSESRLPSLRQSLEAAFPHEENRAYMDGLCTSPLPRVRAQRLGALSLLPSLLTAAGLGSERWILHRDEQGRPYCEGTDGSPAGFDFNLSHTDTHVAAALLVGSGKVGVDIEELIPPARAIPLLHRYCTPGELALLHELPPDEALAADFFTSTWVEREALCKQDGGGMPLRFDTARLPEGVLLWTGYLPDTETKIAVCAPLQNAPRLPRSLPDSLHTVFS